MIFGNNDDDKNDFFENSEIEESVKKKPELTPDDPRYWEQEESRWAHLPKPRRKGTWKLWLILSLVLVALIIAGYLRYFSPYIEFATQYGYVDSIERRGTVFKTYEGVLIPYKELMDTTRIYQRDFPFTAADAEIASRMKELQGSGVPVKVEYKRYHATVPWRGASRTLVVSVDTVNPDKILPPEFAPASH